MRLPLLVLFACPGTHEEPRGTGEAEDTAPQCDTSAPRFLDADGDGWGDVLREGCLGTVIDGGDCDDANPAVHPYAGDVCGDAIDDDCSGTDRVCGSYAPEDASTVMDIDAFCIAGDRATATHDAVVSVVLPTGILSGFLGAVPLRSGSYVGEDEILATWTQSSAVGSDFLWEDFTTFDLGAGPSLFAPMRAQGMAKSGVFRFDPPWEGDRLETEADVAWEQEDLRGVDVARGFGTAGADRLVVSGNVEDPSGRVAWLVPPAAGSGSLDAVAATYIAGAWVEGAGDLDGDGIEDVVSSSSQYLGELGIVPGPIEDGTFDAVDLQSRTWTQSEWSFVGAATPLGDVDGDGLAEVAIEGIKYTQDPTVGRRIFVWNATANSGLIEQVAARVLVNDGCPQWSGVEGAPPCEAWFRPHGVGDVTADGVADILVEGAYPTSEPVNAFAALVPGGDWSGTVEVVAGADGVVWFDPGAGGEWVSPGGTAVQTQGGFSADFDADGALDVFLFHATESDSAPETEHLLGFRGPIE